MDRLQALNLKEVKIKRGVEGSEDEIPARAMVSKYSLIKLVLPDKLKAIRGGAFCDCKNLTGSLIIPEGVTEIELQHFMVVKVLPEHYHYLLHWKCWDGIIRGGEAGAFRGCKFVCELILPEN